jgi:UPF0755 protein
VKKKKSSPLRFLAALLSGVVAGVIILAVAAAALAVWSNNPPEGVSRQGAEYMPDPGVRYEYSGEGDAIPASVLFTVNEGESSYAVGRRLERLHLIRTRYFWDALSRYDGEFVKAGTYRIPLPAKTTEIRGILTGGQTVLLSVTIPEGVTLKKAASLMEEAGICGAEEFLAASRSRALLDEYNITEATFEGWLYPDTYLFPGSFPAEMAVRKMADTFFGKVKEIAPGYETLSADDLNRAVVLASIVEREYRVPEEAAVMAGVFYNRLKKGMALQSCATVEYVITDILGRPHPKVLYNADVEIDNEYNTYLYKGLPPGPISLPGATALNAAFNPADTDYLFFRLVDERAGKHYFSKSFDDHIKAGQLFVKGNS